MAFGLEDNYVLLDDNEFATQKEVNTNRHYFEERIEVKGILNYGLVPKDTEVRISLADNGVSVPIIIDSIVALSGDSTSDELYFYLYRAESGKITRVGVQRYSNSQMPVDFPDGIIFPDMVLGVKPVRGDATIVVYVKPVKILFEATPEVLPASDGSGS